MQTMKTNILRTMCAAAIFGIAMTAYAENTESVFPAAGEKLQPDPAYVDTYASKLEPPFLSHSYVGWQIGIPSLSIDRTVTYPGTQNKAKADISSPQISTGLLFGSGKTFSGIYLGWETQLLFNYMRGKKQFSASDDSSLVSYQIPATLNIDFKPGYLVNQKFLVFLNLGLAGSYLKVTGSTPANSHIDDFKSFLPGWRAGLGVEFFLSDSFSMRCDYTYTSYFNSNKDFMDSTSGITYANKFAISHGIVNLGFVYHF